MTTVDAQTFVADKLRITDKDFADWNLIAEKFQSVLGAQFKLPETDDLGVWRKEIETAQAAYEIAKSFETTLVDNAALVKFYEVDVWDYAYANTVASSAAAKKDAAESSEEWREYQRVKLRVDREKRQAEKWHSIAYQRLETLRGIFKKLSPVREP